MIDIMKTIEYDYYHENSWKYLFDIYIYIVRVCKMFQCSTIMKTI